MKTKMNKSLVCICCKNLNYEGVEQDRSHVINTNPYPLSGDSMSTNMIKKELESKNGVTSNIMELAKSSLIKQGLIDIEGKLLFDKNELSQDQIKSFQTFNLMKLWVDTLSLSEDFKLLPKRDVLSRMKSECDGIYGKKTEAIYDWNQGAGSINITGKFGKTNKNINFTKSMN